MISTYCSELWWKLNIVVFASYLSQEEPKFKASLGYRPNPNKRIILAMSQNNKIRRL